MSSCIFCGRSTDFATAFCDAHMRLYAEASLCLYLNDRLRTDAIFAGAVNAVATMRDMEGDEGESKNQKG